MKNAIAIFFTVLFMAINFAPSILVAFDDSIDISSFCDFSENEKEKKDKESEKTFEVFFEVNRNASDGFSAFKILKQTEYRFKNYLKPHLNLISPPPEQHIL